MSIHLMKHILFLFTAFVFFNPRSSLAINYNQSSQVTNVVRNFDQLLQLWMNDIYTPNNTDAIQILMKNPTELGVTLTNFTCIVLAGCIQIDHVYHGIRRYEDPKMIAEAASKKVNQTLCLNQLEELADRAARLQKDGFNSTDIDLFRLLDTFGRAGSGLTYLQSMWPGNYKECINYNIKLTEGSTNFRYCIGSLKFKHWTQTRMTEYYTYESAVCLPEACDSLDYRGKFHLVEKLIKTNIWNHLADELSMSNLYCLPDKSSSYLAWWMKPEACIFIIVLILWILAQVYATSVMKDKRTMLDNNSNWYKVTKSLDIKSNFTHLITSKDNKKYQTSIAHSSKVNLEISEGIKVICLAMVMVGHFLMITSASMKSIATFNSVELANYLFTISNEAPAFLISIFFLLTGIVTSYQVFNSRLANSIFFSPGIWFLLVLKRYLRLLPTYVFMVAYSKYIAKYTSSGPYWDYGTSAFSPRKLCEQESWWSPITFTANFKPMLESCVVPGWYLASDIQFVALSPIFLTGLAIHPTITKIFIYIIMLLSCTASVVVNFFNKIPDFTPVYRIDLFSNGFLTTFMNEVYTRPHYRITAFLVGILIGHYLYERKYAKQEPASSVTKTTGRGWMDLLMRHDKIYTAFMLVNILGLLHIGILSKLIPFQSKLAARIIVSALFPVLLSAAAVVMGLYFILASEGAGSQTINSILSSKFWSPLAKMNLTVLVCHCEVIIFITHSITLPIYLEFFTHLSYIILSLLGIYTVSMLLFIFIEAPCGQLLRNFIQTKL